MKLSIIIEKYFQNGEPLRGFTIIELIITIFILSVAIVGVFGAFSIMVILTSEVADRLTAAYLTQEGIEIVRNIRDSNWINMDANPDTAGWGDGLLPPNIDCDQGCEADYTTGTNVAGATVISRWSGPGRYLNIKNGFYAYDAINPSPTKFRRKITITCLPNNDCSTDYIMEVSVEVFWDQKPSVLNPEGVAGSIQAEDTLYDWY